MAVLNNWELAYFPFSQQLPILSLFFHSRYFPTIQSCLPRKIIHIYKMYHSVLEYSIPLILTTLLKG